MIISLVAAMGENRVIGIENRLPWRLPADMQHFRRLTMGKPVLMGRKTFDSIGKPLAGRLNIVVTRDLDFHPKGVLVAHSVDEGLAAAADAPEVMVIGGASFYRQLLSRAHRVYLTEIRHRFAGDAFFPELDREAWQVTERSDHFADDVNPYPYSFIRFDRRQAG